MIREINTTLNFKDVENKEKTKSFFERLGLYRLYNFKFKQNTIP